MRSFEVADLAGAVAVPMSELAQWVELGVVRLDTSFPDAVGRARLVRLALRRGISLDQIAAAAEGDLLARCGALMPTVPAGSLEDKAAEAGVDTDLAAAVWAAAGFDPGFADEGDAAALSAIRSALEAGLPEDAILQLARVLGDSLGRVADAEVRLSHLYLGQRLRAEVVPAADAAQAVQQATETLLALVEPTVLYLHRRALARAIQEDLVLHLAERLDPDRPPGKLPVGVLFVDLAGFTPLTEVMGDEAAADVLDRFSQLVRVEALAFDGRVVKQIGDEFMLVFHSADEMVRYAMHLADVAGQEPNFPELRMGAHVGHALYREADYLGTTVNLAARVVATAGAGELVVTRDVRDAAATRVRWRPVGARHVKGVREAVELFSLDVGGRPVLMDPVCGMRLDATVALVDVDDQNIERRFCSERCRDEFRRDPRRYVP